jgi:hypothetical protein
MEAAEQAAAMAKELTRLNASAKGAHEGEYISTVQMCIYDWTSYLVLNRMNAVLSSLHLVLAAAALVPWAGGQEEEGEQRAPAGAQAAACVAAAWYARGT